VPEHRAKEDNGRAAKSRNLGQDTMKRKKSPPDSRASTTGAALNRKKRVKRPVTRRGAAAGRLPKRIHKTWRKEDPSISRLEEGRTTKTANRRGLPQACSWAKGERKEWEKACNPRRRDRRCTVLDSPRGMGACSKNSPAPRAREKGKQTRNIGGH